jgi:ABC-2 type transport system ATP-binding protein
MTTDVVVTTRGLTKRFGHVTAVEDLDLEVRRGEIYAFLGRNGAGKTTTIRMILGLIRPMAGEVRVFGEPVRSSSPEWLRRVGCLVETATAYPNLTVRENLQLHRRLTGAPAKAVADVIDQLGLGDAADRRAGHLSLGNKQRLGLARALVHAPDLLVLDEPANGLDPAGIVEIRGLLRSLADDHGTTVFVSSHILVEVAHLADRIGIVHAGRLVEELDRAALVAAARAFSAEQLTEQQRADALLTLELERYFLARTDGSVR